MARLALPDPEAELTVLVESLIIEFAAAADAAEISALSRKYIEYDLRRVYTPARIRASIRSPAKNVVVARCDRKLIGFGIMTYGRNIANLDLLAVKRSCRRRGVAARLVTWLEKVAVTAGIQQVFIQVRQRNTRAIHFYQKLGFIVVDEIPGYYQGRETAVVMGKNIRPIFRRGEDSTVQNAQRRIWKIRTGTSRR